MKIYTGQNVWDAALDRIRWLLAEFPNATVSFSGGKDSTVVLQLTLKVAEEMGRLPFPVMFIDQEAEWQATDDYVRHVMYDPRVKPLWYQMPIRMANATATARTTDEEEWLWCWEDGAEWMREKDPISIHENTFGTVTFYHLFGEILRGLYGEAPAVTLGGLRTEESPGRLLGLTAAATYKGQTWGGWQGSADQHYVMYPIYDWSYKDVWKAIHDNNWAYNKVYDYMYQYGVPVRKMRVSNLHHGEALGSLAYLPEVEPETWERLQKRLSGIHVAAHAFETLKGPSELPWMFRSWAEYRDYLVENLIQNEVNREKFVKQFKQQERRYAGTGELLDELIRTQIGAVIINDHFLTRLSTWQAANPPRLKAAKQKKQATHDDEKELVG